MADPISFTYIQLPRGVTPATAPNELTSANVGGTTGVASRALAAIVGDGDRLLETAERGYVLGAATSTQNKVASLVALNGANDPVTISAHGRQNASTVGSLGVEPTASTGVAFNNTWGFGLQTDGESNGRGLQLGESISWALNPVDGAAQRLASFSFRVDTGSSTSATEIALDFDGNVARTGSYTTAATAANADAALRLAARNGDVVAVDFGARVVTLNGVAVTGPTVDALFVKFETSPQNILTIGGVGSTGFTVRDLVLAREPNPSGSVNLPPSITLANVVTALPEDADVSAPIRIADIVVTDDGVGANALGLDGSDAGLFEIVGTTLFLKAGARLDHETNAQLDIAVTVDDPAISGVPDAAAPLTVAVEDRPESALPRDILSFAYLQLRPGVTPATAPNQLATTDLSATTAVANRAFATILGDGDTQLETSERGFVLGAATSNLSKIGSLATLNGATDPVMIRAHGRLSSSSVGDLPANPTSRVGVAFNSDWGFGLQSFGESNARGLSRGDAISWTLNPVDGAAQRIATFTFRVDMGTSNATTQVALDFDGDVVQTGTYAASAAAANADVALQVAARNGDVISIDFNAGSVTLNGAALDGPAADAFFAAYAAGAQNRLTVGGVGTASFSVRDLVLTREAGPVDPPANQPPTVTLANVVTTLPEDADTSAAIRIADIVVADDGLGVNTLGLDGADAGLFAIVGGALFLKAGAALDFETRPRLDVRVTVDDAAVGGSPDAAVDVAIDVLNRPERYGAITLDGALGDWDPAALLASTVADGATYTVRASFQQGAFLIALDTGGARIGAGTSLWLDADLNAATGFQVFGSAVGAEYTLTVTAAGAVELRAGAPTSDVIAVLDAGLSDDGRTLELALPAALAGGATLANLFVSFNDAVFVPGDFSGPGLRIGENQAPSVALVQILDQIRENADTALPVKVADIVVGDPDGVGQNILALSGADAARFEIVGTALFLRAGVALDFEERAQLQVTVTVDDTAIGSGPDGAASLVLGIEDVNEDQGQITLDGSLAEWAAGTRLDTLTTGVSGFAVHGAYQNDAFVLGLSTAGGPIGPNSTIWLNSDLNAGSGHLVFGFAAGAEFNVNIGADGVPRLYSGAAGETLVAANLDYVFNADRSVLEIALPSALMGGSTAANVYIDVNDATFLPNDYTSNGFRIEEARPLLPRDPTMRIAIVYSETSADYYFDKTAYGQLFMATQHQAMQAGIPFDLLSEADLTDIANLVDYEAIVFPGLSHVQSSRLAAITETLTSAVRDYKIGLVAMGNFLTNTETGASIAGDSYARMKALLGVTLDSAAATDGVTLRAATTSHPVNDLWAANETVGQYTNNSYLTFRDVTGSGQTLFNQTVDRPDAAPDSVAAVIATTTGGRNVHFATDAAFGNNNILAEAINWAARGDAPDVGLQMTRGSSLFFSRNDMDQSQEYFAVVEQNPGIYDAMLPIVEQWYQDYGFVGSYYINVGANPPDQRTDWAVSMPYYQRLLALENEIGTHSYTHPEDTNILLRDGFTTAEWQTWLANTEMTSTVRSAITRLGASGTQAEIARLLALTDPRDGSPVDPGALDATERAILAGSVRFQFEYSRLVIAQRLGIAADGGAVPGAPEKLPVSTEILKHLEYLTGGYAAAGAGYPGAFGFLTPELADKVYFAPNVSFDFSLIGFRGLTVAQAEAVWQDEYQAIVDKGAAPIIHFPWHDYGPTNWTDPGAPDPGYRLSMFTNFIARAAADGTEFVTGADLAQRIESFARSSIEIDRSGGQIVVTATGSDLGKFALDVETGAGQVIRSVDDWYAYDAGKVFLPKNGGAFDIALGAQAVDVTRIAALPMRAELLGVSGDGANLSFSFNGKGDLGVELREWGVQSVVANGADAWLLNGERLTMTYAAATAHQGSVSYRSGDAVAGTDGGDFIIGATAGRRIDAGLGDDFVLGDGGADTFLFGIGRGADTVLDFTLSEDRIELFGGRFATASDALAAIQYVDGGARLAYDETDSLFLKDITLAQLTLDNIVLNDAML